MKKKIYLTIIALIPIFGIQAQVSYDSLVSFYPLNINSKDAIGSNDGLVFEAKFTSDRFNHEKGAFKFDGVNDYINLRANFDYPQRTISLWFNTDTIDEIERHIYISDNPNLKYGFTQIKVWNIDGIKQIRSSAGIPGGVAEANSEVIEKEWYMITLVADEDSVKHYLNGSLIGKFSNGNIKSMNGDTSALLGTSRVYDRYFKGKIDDVRIYNRTLKPYEITSLFNEGKCVETIYNYDTIRVNVYDTVHVYNSISVTDTLVINTGIVNYIPLTFANTIKIYPNPTNDYIYIDTKSINDGFKISIINSLGRKVYETNIEQTHYTINLSSWSGKGIYFVRLYDYQQKLLDIKKIILK